MNREIITGVLGWCALMNIGLLISSALFIVLFKKKIVNIHNKMFGLNENELSKVYINTLAHYEIAIFMFNIVPYLALKITG